MQLHPGVLRDHDPAIHATYGPDQGHDIPVATEFTRSLRPLLERFGHAAGFRIVLFTVDETVYSRELAPLAGVYPAVRLGAPWWFLDSPDGMRRFRELVTETAGFYNTSGFVDDTRAFLSIPARHDLARRIDAGYLANLVVQHRLDEDDALQVAQDLAYNLARDTYLSYTRPHGVHGRTRGRGQEIPSARLFAVTGPTHVGPAGGPSGDLGQYGDSIAESPRAKFAPSRGAGSTGRWLWAAGWGSGEG